MTIIIKCHHWEPNKIFRAHEKFASLFPALLYGRELCFKSRASHKLSTESNPPLDSKPLGGRAPSLGTMTTWHCSFPSSLAGGGGQAATDKMHCLHKHQASLRLHEWFSLTCQNQLANLRGKVWNNLKSAVWIPVVYLFNDLC